MNKYPKLFSPVTMAGIDLKNRITMAPLFLGMSNRDGTAGDLIIDHYREMGESGAAMVVVESSAVDPSGMGTPNMLRADDDQFLPGLKRVALAIKSGGAVAFLQINHTGRYAYHDEKWGPSLIEMDYATVREMPKEEIDRTVACYADAARRIREAGFEGVEIHGGTGYLPVQFFSPRTNKRTDEYGGSLENRMRFPLEVFEAVKDAVGADYPVGYRFIADEWLPDGLHVEETSVLARELQSRSVAYLSVMAGTYDSFLSDSYQEADKQEGFMADFADQIKYASPDSFIIAAGRVQSPETGEEIISSGKADAVGIARVLLADPLWPKKAAGEVNEPMNPCKPGCQYCMKRVMGGKISLCIRWPEERRNAFFNRIGEKPNI